jgi:hypothetical protein
MDESVRRLLEEHLPEPPEEMANPPLAAIRRRARRRTGAQVGAAIAAVAAVTVGTTALLDAEDPVGPPVADSPSSTVATDPRIAGAGMLQPTYLPPGYDALTVEWTSDSKELRYENPSAEAKVPLVIRRQPETAAVPAEWEPIRQVTAHGQAAAVFMVANGGMTVTWLESGSRYSVSFEAPPNSQIDFAIDETIDVLLAVADGLR